MDIVLKVYLQKAVMRLLVVFFTEKFNLLLAQLVRMRFLFYFFFDLKKAALYFAG